MLARRQTFDLVAPPSPTLPRVMAQPCFAWTGEGEPRSCSEGLLVFLLDAFDLRLELGWIGVDHLDLGERLAAGLLLHLRMERAQAADIASSADQESTNG